MESRNWESSFEIGNEKIDFEHRIFYGLIQKFADEMNERHDLARLKRMMLEIQKYAEFHFVSEQNLMFEIGFPALDKHVTLHAELLDKLERASSDLLADMGAYAKFVVFLLEWFSFHTLHEDRKIAEYFSQKSKVD